MYLSGGALACSMPEALGSVPAITRQQKKEAVAAATQALNRQPYSSCSALLTVLWYLECLYPFLSFCKHIIKSISSVIFTIKFYFIKTANELSC